MFKAKLVTQTKVSPRGYIEVRRTFVTLLPLALIIGSFGVWRKRATVVLGGLVLEFISYTGKVCDYQYEPAHGSNFHPLRGRLSAVGARLHNNLGTGGTHRRMLV